MGYDVKALSEAIEDALIAERIFDVDGYGWLNTDDHDPEFAGYAMWATSPPFETNFENTLEGKSPRWVATPYQQRLIELGTHFEGLMKAARYAIGSVLIHRDTLSPDDFQPSPFEFHEINALVTLSMASDRARDFVILAVTNELPRANHELDQYRLALFAARTLGLGDDVVALEALTPAIKSLKDARNAPVHKVALKVAKVQREIMERDRHDWSASKKQRAKALVWDRDAVRQRLEAVGFVVDPIKEHRSERRPDLMARADTQTLYVEVKTRAEDVVLRSKMESVPAGVTAAVLTDLGKRNSISADIKHAQSQINAVAGRSDFRLLWFRANNGPLVHDALEQIGATLYGIRTVVVGGLGDEHPRPCAYAGYADFYRFQEIDGTMVEVDQLITLLLNPLSARRRAFASSRIAQVLGPSVFDVDKACEERSVYMVDGDAPRDNDEKLLEHLRSRYPGERFNRFAKACTGTFVTTIDGRRSGGR